MKIILLIWIISGALGGAYFLWNYRWHYLNAHTDISTNIITGYSQCRTVDRP